MNHSLISARRGQAIVEVALVLPVLILFLFGTLDLGRAIYYQFTLAQAVREGVRQAVIETNSDSMATQAVIDKGVGLSLTSADVTLSGSWDGGSVLTVSGAQAGSQDWGIRCHRRDAGSTVTVSATYLFQPVTPIISSLAGGGILLQSSSTMTVE